MVSYEYVNEPKPLAPTLMQIHRGFADLTLSLDGRVLDGDYYTGRGRQTYGSLHLEKETIDSSKTANALEPVPSGRREGTGGIFVLGLYALGCVVAYCISFVILYVGVNMSHRTSLSTESALHCLECRELYRGPEIGKRRSLSLWVLSCNSNRFPGNIFPWFHSCFVCSAINSSMAHVSQIRKEDLDSLCVYTHT